MCLCTQMSFHVNSSYAFLKNIIIVFFWLCWVFLAPCRLSLGVASRGLPSSCGAQASCCDGVSSGGAPALEHGFSNCAPWAHLPLYMWDLPGPGIEPVLPVWAGVVLSIGPQGSPLKVFLYSKSLFLIKLKTSFLFSFISCTLGQLYPLRMGFADCTSGK